MNVVILAAGQGKRMFSDLPKVLHPLAGKALVQHVMDTARTLHPKTLCVVYGHGGDLVKNTLAAPDLAFALQAEQLGTGHAVLQAMPHLTTEGITLILYGDVPLTSPKTLENLCAKAKDQNALAVLTVTLDDPKGYGRIVKDGQGRVTSIVEEKDATDDLRKIQEINTGIMAIPSKRLSDWLSRLSNHNAQKEYYLTDVVAMAVKDGVPVCTAQPDFEWEVLGVNSQVQLAYLERIYQKNQAQSLLEAGVHLADPDRIDVRGTLTCGRDVFIDVGCVFEGSVVLEDGVKIAPYCVLKNMRVAKNVAIQAFSHLEGASIGQNAKIGPFARLRPGATLLEEVHIGNFVEVKKSTIGNKSKVNHLSYIGDTTIGERVNVGAGTITCNYDGVNKFQTVIEDDVFIGSDTQLVAPVSVGRGATLGAGTTLTKDAPPDTLTISRAKQVSIEGWRRPVKKPKA